jgi:DnaJ-class molecular chaperone
MNPEKLKELVFNKAEKKLDDLRKTNRVEECPTCKGAGNGCRKCSGSGYIKLKDPFFTARTQYGRFPNEL